MLRFAFPLLLACAAAPAVAQPTALNPNMDYDGHIALMQEVRPYRLARLIDWNRFAAAARERNVLILDARSERQFAEGHIRGAVNLPLTEFSEAALAEVIGPDRNRPILIYCNNNFSEDRRPVILKTGRLAINLSTFTHLYGYGYRNIRELGETVTMNDPRIRWVTGPAQSTSSRAR
ncbi:rhodanese-like domain-containing protein [Sphingosinicella sp.]|uniref:rhodanese-like domain-containing protein n=1 Tax=Sphingosinicella sp. TaxID=1917971 RepID=UPI0040382E4D